MQVAYHDVPYKAYEVFVNALASSYLKKERIIPSLLEGHNPAGKHNIIILFRKS